jgi:hypothetical protein
LDLDGSLRDRSHRVRQITQGLTERRVVVLSDCQLPTATDNSPRKRSQTVTTLMPATTRAATCCIAHLIPEPCFMMGVRWWSPHELWSRPRSISTVAGNDKPNHRADWRMADIHTPPSRRCRINASVFTVYGPDSSPHPRPTRSGCAAAGRYYPANGGAPRGHQTTGSAICSTA